MLPSASLTAENASYFQCSWGEKKAVHFMTILQIWKQHDMDLLLDCWHCLPGRRAQHLCVNLIEWILKQGLFPPRLLWSRPCAEKPEGCRLFYRLVFPFYNMIFKYNIQWFWGVRGNWSHLNLFHRQLKLLCDSVQETKGSICRTWSSSQGTAREAALHATCSAQVTEK